MWPKPLSHRVNVGPFELPVWAYHTRDCLPDPSLKVDTPTGNTWRHTPEYNNLTKECQGQFNRADLNNSSTKQFISHLTEKLRKLLNYLLPSDSFRSVCAVCVKSLLFAHEHTNGLLNFRQR
jgi:hypothetical protein